MPPRISSPLLVGRDEALAILTGAIAASLAGAPGFTVVRGEAGIGKSRLVGEMLAQLPAGTRHLVGECLDIGQGGLPYLPLAEVLRRLARTLPPATLDQVLGPGRGDLSGLVPELAAQAAAATTVDDTSATSGVEAVTRAAPAELTSGLAQARLFERVLGTLRGLAALEPLVLVIEDVHWIDRATRDLLTFLSRNLTDERLAVVLTVREGDLPSGHPILGWLAEIARLPSTVEVEPDRLDRSAVGRQLEALAGVDLPQDRVDRIWRRSEGNPLFVEELYAAGPDDDSSPRSAVAVLLVRLARLEPEARSVVEAAAVAARPVDDRLLAAVLDLAEGEPDLDRALSAAMANGVLELDRTSDRYRFRHELFREVVEGQLLPGPRRRLHERLARCLEARPDLADPSPAGAAGELAVHFAEAGLVADAYLRSIDAAGAAEAVHAFGDAVRHLERALALEARIPAGMQDPAARIDLRTRTSDAADLAGVFERALELARDALDLVDPVVDPVAAGMLHSRIGFLMWSLGDGPAALASHEEAVRLVPASPATRERAKVLGSLGGALMGEGRWAASKEVCEAAIACAIAVDAPAEESRARNMLGSDLVALGDLDAGLAELREARRIAEVARRPDTLIVAHYNLALNLVTADQPEDAIREARAGLAVARDAGLERRFGQDLAALIGDALIRVGRLDEAQGAIADGLALDPAGKGTVYLATVRARLGAIRGEAGVAARWRAGLDLPSLDPDVAAFVAAVAAESLILEGRANDAVDIAEAGLARLDGLDDVLWSPPLVALGLRGLAEQVEAMVGRRATEPAGEAGADGRATPLDRLVAHLDWLDPRTRTTSGRGHVALARGELARIAGGSDAAAWLLAISAFDAVPDPLAAAYARLRAAEAALRAKGLRADVADLLHTASTAAEQAGARPLAGAVATLAGRARITSPIAEADPVAPVLAASTPSSGSSAMDDGDPLAAAMALGLSAREVEVLTLVTAGYTNGEIAERLFITRKTAAVHVTHILDKLGVANRVGAAMIGARVGLERLAPDYSE